MDTISQRARWMDAISPVSQTLVGHDFPANGWMDAISPVNQTLDGHDFPANGWMDAISPVSQTLDGHDFPANGWMDAISPVSQTLDGHDLPASALDGRDSPVSQALQLGQRSGSTSAAEPGIIIVDFVTNDFLVLIVFPVLLSSTLLRTTLSCSLRRYAVGTAPWIRTSAVRGTVGRRRQQRRPYVAREERLERARLADRRPLGIAVADFG